MTIKSYSRLEAICDTAQLQPAGVLMFMRVVILKSADSLSVLTHG